MKKGFSKEEIIKSKYLLFAIVALWLGLEFVVLGPFSYIRIGDNLDHFIPGFVSMKEYFLENGITYWFPQIGLGIDRLSVNATYFHIANAFFFIFPPWLAYQIILLLSLFGGGYFTYRLCKDSLNLSELSSMYAGLAFAASFALARNDIIPFFLGISILPFALWAIELMYKKTGNVKYLLAILLGTVFSFFSSISITLPFTLVAVLLWFIVVRRKFSFSLICLLSIFGLCAIVWQVPAIWALLSNAPLSSRAESYYSSSFLGYLITVKRLLMQNIISIALALIGLFFVRLKEFRFTAILSILVVIIVFIQSYRLLLPYFGSYLGLFQGFGFDRFFILVPFFAALGGALGLEFIPDKYVLRRIGTTLESKEWKVKKIIWVIAILVIVLSTFGVKVSHVSTWLSGGSYVANAKSQDILNLPKPGNEEDLFRVATITNRKYVVLISPYPNLYGLEILGGEVLLPSKRFHDFWYQIVKRRNMPPHSFYLFWHATDEEKSEFKNLPTKYINLDLLSLANVKYLISLFPTNHPDLTLLSRRLQNGEWENYSTFQKGLYLLKENFEGRSLYVYQNEMYFPRFYLVDQVKSFPSRSELLDALNTAEANHLRNTVYLEKKYLSQIDTDNLGFRKGELTVKHYSPDHIVLSVDSDGPSILIASNNYSPYWECRVNGLKTEIVPAYHTFWGVYLGSGVQEVRFDYSPPYKILGSKTP